MEESELDSNRSKNWNSQRLYSEICKYRKEQLNRNESLKPKSLSNKIGSNPEMMKPNG